MQRSRQKQNNTNTKRELLKALFFFIAYAFRLEIFACKRLLTFSIHLYMLTYKNIIQRVFSTLTRIYYTTQVYTHTHTHELDSLGYTSGHTFYISGVGLYISGDVSI